MIIIMIIIIITILIIIIIILIIIITIIIIYIYIIIYIWDKLVSFVCNCTYEKPSVPGEGDSGRSIQETYFFMHPPARRRAREDTGREPTGTDMDLKDAEVAVFSFTTIRMR
jgi:hypothetical protein